MRRRHSAPDLEEAEGRRVAAISSVDVGGYDRINARGSFGHRDRAGQAVRAHLVLEQEGATATWRSSTTSA